MTTYSASAVSDTVIAYEKPITLQQGRALRDNPIAIGEGASGAPRIIGAGLKLLADYPVLTTAAADTVDASVLGTSTFTNASAGGTTYVSAGTFTVVLATGSLRFKWTASITGGATVNSRIKKNGTVIATKSGTGAKSEDVTVIPTDVIEIEVQRATGSVGETASVNIPTVFADDAYVVRSAYVKHSTRNSS